MDQAQGNIEVVDGALSALERGDLDAAMKRFEEDVRWGVAQWLPQAGLHTGAAEVRAMLEARRERFGGRYHFLHMTAYATSDHVFVETTRSGDADARTPGSEHVMLVFHLVMGRIREVRELIYAVH